MKSELVEYAVTFLRFILAFVFIIAAADKISDPAAFAQSIENYRVFPIWSVNIIALFIPWLEIYTGVLLISGTAVRENLIIIGLLLIAFIILVLSAVFRDLNIDCGCFGTSNAQKVGFYKVIENSVLLVIARIVYRFGPGKFYLKRNGND